MVPSSAARTNFDPICQSVPRWIRTVRPETIENMMFSAGATLARLDPMVRDSDPVGRLWRQRLALQAAQATCAWEGRSDAIGALRDAVALCGPDGDPGPTGRRLQAWRQLGQGARIRRPGLTRLFDLPDGDVARAGLGSVSPVRRAAELAARILEQGPSYRGLAIWAADEALAEALDWASPVPLLAAHLPRTAFRHTGDAWVVACAAAYAKGAITAIDMRVDLARRAAALCATAPRLRSKDAGAFVDRLLIEDAVAARAGALRSDRAARRTMDRLVGLGVVRELTGRSTFRLYGL